MTVLEPGRSENTLELAFEARGQMNSQDAAEIESAAVPRFLKVIVCPAVEPTAGGPPFYSV